MSKSAARQIFCFGDETVNKETTEAKMFSALEAAGCARPLVPSVTNCVTAGFVADCQLAAGASAVMINMPDEARELAERCDAFYINLGTIFPIYEATIPAAAERLSQLGRPWALDPVAAGLGELRTKLLMQIREYRPSVIRGNASEIIALARLWKLYGGVSSACVVDSSAAPADAEEAATVLAKFTGGAVVVSGADDYVTDGRTAAVSYGGSLLMKRNSGFGCALGAVAAGHLPFAEPFVAALGAVNAFNAAGREAEKTASAQGSFRTAFIDRLQMLAPQEIVHNTFEIKE